MALIRPHSRICAECGIMFYRTPEAFVWCSDECQYASTVRRALRRSVLWQYRRFEVGARGQGTRLDGTRIIHVHGPSVAYARERTLLHCARNWGGRTADYVILSDPEES